MITCISTRERKYLLMLRLWPGCSVSHVGLFNMWNLLNMLVCECVLPSNTSRMFQWNHSHVHTLTYVILQREALTWIATLLHNIYLFVLPMNICQMCTEVRRAYLKDTEEEKEEGSDGFILHLWVHGLRRWQLCTVLSFLSSRSFTLDDQFRDLRRARRCRFRLPARACFSLCKCHLLLL